MGRPNDANDTIDTIEDGSGDFDRLDDLLGDTTFELATSSFGVIFAPNPRGTLDRIARRVAPGVLVGIAGWDPVGVFFVPESMLELLPQVPPMPDMHIWTTDIAELCAGSALEVVKTHVDELRIPFESVADSADQLRRWSGGWAQLLETFDALGVGPEATNRFHEQLAGFAATTYDGIELCADYYTSVRRRVAA